MEEITISAQSRGWVLLWDNDHWIYEDNGEIFLDDCQRPCKKCGRMPTKEGFDACLGYLEGVKYACCGHGITERFIIKDE